MRAARRGMWILAVSSLATIASAGVVVGLVLASLEYDLDNGLLEPFVPVWGPAVLLAFAIAVTGPVLSGRRWARWVAAVGYAAGAVWILFRADLEPAWLAASLATAACWALAAVAFTVLPSIGEFVAEQSEQASSYARLFDVLAAEGDARRWLAVAREWETAGVLSRRDRARIAQALRQWAEGRGSVGEDIVHGIEALAPPASARGERLPARIVTRWRMWRGRRRPAGTPPG